MVEGNGVVSDKTRLTMGILFALVTLFVTVTLPIGGGLLVGYGRIVQTATALDGVQTQVIEIKDEMRQIRADQKIVNDRLATAVAELSVAIGDLRVQIAQSESARKK